MSRRILIIDDEDHIRRMIRLTLETADYEVDEAADGVRGLETFGDGSAWDAVLLDQKMPGMDGLETLRRIKERAPDASVIMVTAFASIELAVDAMKLGANDFVRKPMTPETVRNAVAAALTKPSGSTLDADAERVRTEARAPSRPLIQTITMNGFQITHPSDLGDDTPDEPGTRRFIVRTPDGREQEVVVEIPDAVIEHAARLTLRRLPPESSFWSIRAERTLAEYLWSEGQTPPERLRVAELSHDDLHIAARWEDN